MAETASGVRHPRASAVIDLSAVRANLAVVRSASTADEVIAVVKAEAYGHGIVRIAEELRADGVARLGVALPSEALELRAAGDRGAILAWLWAPGDPDVAQCVSSDIELGISTGDALEQVVQAAAQARMRAKVHIKVDTGLSRNGVPSEAWREVFEAAAAAQRDGAIAVVGLWSHLIDGEVPNSPVTDEQAARFREAVELADEWGLAGVCRHLGNSGTVWSQPAWEFDAVRSGIALYGLTPGTSLGSSADLGLRPVMTLRARLSNVKALPEGAVVSYAGTWATDRDTVIGLVPVGYADGIPRSGGGVLKVAVGGEQVPIVGRVAMDQFVVDLGPGSTARIGDEVTLFGPGDNGEQTADEWADALGTIGYEIVTRIGARVPREYVGGWS